MVSLSCVFFNWCFCCIPSFCLLTYLYISIKYQTCTFYIFFFLFHHFRGTLRSTSRSTSLLRTGSDLMVWNCYCQISFGGTCFKGGQTFSDVWPVLDEPTRWVKWSFGNRALPLSPFQTGFCLRYLSTLQWKQNVYSLLNRQFNKLQESIYADSSKSGVILRCNLIDFFWLFRKNILLFHCISKLGNWKGFGLFVQTIHNCKHITSFLTYLPSKNRS